MTLQWEPLPWDTEFFGFPIGRVELDGASTSDLGRVEEDARAAGIVCLYGSLDPIDAPLTFEVQRHGWRFVDAATMLSLASNEPPIHRPTGIEFRRGTSADLDQMEQLVATLAAWSRYFLDPRFGHEAALRMQWAGIERAAACETGENSLRVAEHDGEIVAFISRALHPLPVIDTIGTTAQGSRAAHYLVEDSRPWAGVDQPILGGPIAARNVVALRFVNRCGYRIKWVRYRYHRWLDEPVAR